ncbi:serine/threonine-protein kinase [Myxococcota bacterium]|nr:serine/threonine-protein kinase [Myxococcota bacterium]
MASPSGGGAGGGAAGGPRYEVRAVLGSGGMGDVIAVFDPRLQREVALKTIRPERPDLAARFVQEARITGQLQHPGIVPVHELGTTDEGRPFFTMKRVRGRALDQAVARGEPASLLGRLDVFRKVCDAVAYAHDKGVLHRDLKPENVMIGAFGEVLVMDWGLARVLGEPVEAGEEAIRTGDLGLAATREGRVAGTPSWMAPEQARGEVQRLGPAADIYALGGLLWFLLVERPPREGSLEEVLAQARAGVVRPPSRAGGPRPVPRELEAVVLRALAPRPEDRFASVLALREEIDAWVEGRPLHSVRYRPWERLSKWVQRHRAPVLAGGLTAAAALALLLVGLLRYVADVSVARDQAVLEADRARAAERTAALRLAEIGVANAGLLSNEGRLAEAREVLQDARRILREHGQDPRPADLALADLARRGPPPLVTFPAVPGGAARSVHLSPEGDRLLVRGEDDRVAVWTLPFLARRATWAPPPGARLLDLAFVEGRPWALLAEGEGVRRWDLDADAPGALLPVGAVARARWLDQGRAIALSWGDEAVGWWSPAGTVRLPPGRVSLLDLSVAHGRVVALAPEGPLRVHDLATGAVRATFEDAGVAALVDGDLVIAAEEPGGMALVRLVGLGPGERWRRTSAHVGAIRVSASGQWIFTAGVDDLVRTWRAEDGAAEVAFGLSGGLGASGSSDAVGALYASTGEQGRVSLWALPAPGRVSPLAPGAGATCLGLDPGSDLLLAGGEGPALGVVDRPTGRLLERLPLPAEGARDARVLPDGRRVVVAGRDGEVRVFDLERGAQEVVFPLGDRRVTSAAWSQAEQALVLAGSEGRVALHDPVTGALRRSLGQARGAVWSLSPSPDGLQVLATGRGHEDGRAYILGVTGGTSVAELPTTPPRPLYGGAWSPDGQRVVAGDHEGKLWLWDLRQPRSPRVVQAHEGPALAVAFSPDGSLLASSGYDGLVRLWDPEDGRALASLSVTGPIVVDVEFGEGGAVLLVAGSGGVYDQLRLDAATLADERAALVLGPDSPQARARLVALHGALGAWALAARALPGAQGVSDLDRVRALDAAGALPDVRLILAAPTTPALHAWSRAVSGNTL